MAQDPLGQVKQAIRLAIAQAQQAAAQDPLNAQAFQVISSTLQPLVAAGGTLDKASNALVQCRAALAPAAGGGLSAVGAVQAAAASGTTPTGYVGSRTAAGIALGALVVGAGAGFAGGNWFGKKPKKAKENPLGEKKPRMTPGYAMKWDPKDGEWYEVMSPKNAESFRFVEVKTIDESRMAVFTSSSGALYAQLEQNAREAPQLGAGAGAQ